MEQKYYFDNTDIDTNYSTIWYGFLIYNSNNPSRNNIPISENYHQKSNRILDDLLCELCDNNFYVNIINNYIHISVCQDSKYYYHQFEKDIKIAIKEIESKFNVIIESGEFNANECKYNGNQYKYTISKGIDNNIILKKRILNWTTHDTKKKRINKIDELSKSVSNLSIIDK
jgi:hypothetical protein